jgi:autotransporter-associated beta strand protein
MSKDLPTRRAYVLIAAAAVAGLGALPSTARAAADIWTGAADGNWSNASNWTGGNAPPQSGDSLTFTGASTHETTLNDLSGLSVSGITFETGADAYTLGAGNALTLAGAITDSGTAVQTIALPLTLDTPQSLTVAPGGTLDMNGALSGAGSVLASGGGTLSFGAANSYAGSTTLDGLTLRYTADNLAVKSLIFGATAGSTNVSALDLSSANLTATAITSRISSSAGNTVTIGAAKTLTDSGGLSVGFDPLNTSQESRLTMGGAGALNITGGAVTVGNNSSGTGVMTATLDLSGLASFTFTGTEFNLGGRQASITGNRSTGIADLASASTAATNSITVTTMNIGAGSSSQPGGTSTLNLGAGANIIHATTINLGTHRSSGLMTFAGADGGLTIGGSGGASSRANINVGIHSGGGTAAAQADLLLNGHTINVLAGALNIGQITNASIDGAVASSVQFDSGTLDATSILLGSRTDTRGSTTGRLTMGGGNLIVNSASGPGGGTFTMATNTVTGGTPGSVSGVLDLNGGIASINTNIIRGSAIGTSSATINLAGGTLDLLNHNIGAAGAAGAITLNASSGTIRNVASLNGTGGLTKTGAGTLISDGANAWSGDTTLAGGTLSVTGTLPASGNVIVNSGTLGGNGDGATAGVVGNVSVNDGSLRAGTVAGDVGKLTLSSLALHSGNLTVDLGPGSTADLLNVLGNVTLGDSAASALTLTVAGTAPIAGSSYEIIDYGGALSHPADFVINGPIGSSFQLDYATPGKIFLDAVTGNALLTWNGNADGTTWNFTAANFNDGASDVSFANGQDVAFTDSALAGRTTIDVTADVSPANVTVSASSNNYTFTGAFAITGAATLSKSGSSTLLILNNNSYSGNTTINAGTIQVGNGGASGSLGAGNIIDNAALAFDRADSITVANAISGSGTLAQLGAATLTLTGANSYGATTIAAGSTLQIGAGGTTGTLGAGAVADDGTLVFNRSDALSAANAITGSGGVRTIGAGVTTLSGASTYTGPTVISAGTLSAATLAIIGASSNIGAGLNTDAATNAASLVLDGGSLRWTGAAAASTNRNFTLTAAGGTLDASPVGSFALAFSGPGTIAFSDAGPRTLTLAGIDPNPTVITVQSMNLVLADQDGATGKTALVKTGNSAWSLGGANTYSGGTSILQGSLRAASATALGSASVAVASGAQAWLNVAGNVLNNFSIAGIGPTERPANDVAAGFPDGNFGALRLAQNGTNVKGTVTLTGDARITARGATGSGALLSGKITGPFALEFGNQGNQTSLLVLDNPAGDNDWTGTTTINHGIVQIGAANQIPNGAGKGNVLINGSAPVSAALFATLDLYGNDETINGLSSIGDLTHVRVITSAGDATLTLGDNNASATYAGALADGAATSEATLPRLAVSKIGSGTQTFAGADTYTGPTTITGGTLVLASRLTTSSAVTVQPGAKLVLAQGGNNILGTSSLTIAGGNNAWTGQIDLKDNDVIVHSPGTRTVVAARIINQLKQGSNFAGPGSFWTGNGITTSLGGNGSTSYTAVGVIVNDFAVLGGAQTGPLYTSFDGQMVDIDDVLVKYTYFGDADLDGAVTTNDYFQIDNGFLGSKTGWINGDFDYDGAVTTNDYFLIDNAFLGQGSALVPAAMGGAGALSGVTAVPEPASLGIFAVAAARLLTRRRRRRD